MTVARLLACTFVPFLAACTVTPARGPVYEQTEGSQVAFALAEAVRGGQRGDLPRQARAAGLVEAGVCREVGDGRLYCNALRITDTSLYSTHPVGPSMFGITFEEMRLCIASDRAVGFVSGGNRGGPLPQPLYREYPGEFTTLLRSSIVEIDIDPDDVDEVTLSPIYSLTNLSLNAAIDQLGYGGSSSRFEEVRPGDYITLDYPPHQPGERTCRTL